MSVAEAKADSEPRTHKKGSFEYRPRLTDEWLEDIFYRENIGFTGEPEGVVPAQ